MVEDGRPATGPRPAIVLGGLADVAFLRADWQKAFDLRARAVGIWIDRTLRNAGVRSVGTEKAPSEIAQSAGHLSKLVKTASQLQEVEPGKRSALTLATFTYAQWRLSSGTADALAEMAVRNATNDAKLADLVRERQDRVADWQKADKELLGARSVTVDGAQRAIDVLEKRRAEIDTRIAAIDAALK